MTPFTCSRTCTRFMARHSRQTGCYLLFLVALSTLLSMFGCDRDEKVVYVDMDKRETIQRPQQDAALTYAYLPQYSHTVSYKRHNLLVRYLARETGLAIRHRPRSLPAERSRQGYPQETPLHSRPGDGFHGRS